MQTMTTSSNVTPFSGPVHRELGLAPGRPASLVGPSGCGKSIAAYQLALAVAGGLGEAWGVPGLASGPVTFLSRIDAAHRHIPALAHAYRVDLKKAPLRRERMETLSVWQGLNDQQRTSLFQDQKLVVFDDLSHLVAEGSLPEVVQTLHEIEVLSRQHQCTALVVYQEVDPPYSDTRAFDVGALDRFWSTQWIVAMSKNETMRLRRQLHPHVAQTIDLKITGTVDTGERLVPIPAPPPC